MKKFLKKPLIAIFLVSVSALFASSAYSKILDVIKPYLSNPSVDVIHYHVKAEVREMPPKAIKMEALIDIKALSAQNEIELHFEKSVIAIKSVSFENSQVQFALLNGIANKYGLSGDVLAVQLPRSLDKDEVIQLAVQYEVQKQDWTVDDMGLFYVPADKNSGQDLLITRNWPYYGRYWLPSNDSPDDVASISYDITVPNGYVVAANGILKQGDEKEGSGLQSNGLRRFEWQQDKPTTSYNFVFAVGAFDVMKKDICYNRDNEINDREVDCAQADKVLPMVVYYNQNNPQAKGFLRQINKAASASIYFSKLFGDYAFEKIGFIQSPYPFAMESTSMIVLNRPGSAVHEIVHHWWGNNVHFRHWGDFWISEGFTTYFTGFYDEYKAGTNTTCLTDDPKAVLNHSAETDPNEIFDSIPYCKGAHAIQDLRRQIVLTGRSHEKSTEVFLLLMRRTYEAHISNRLSTEAFVEFVRSQLLDAYKAKGISNVTQEQIDEMVTYWKGLWFKGL